ncbi:MAG: NAD(P)/FAD-dependent oxidoreductase [Candidatus Woesearchaeota archaeon]
MKQYDVIIIGTGPAGLSAAIYTARAELKTLVLGKTENAQLWKAHTIENYFGIESMHGHDMLELGVKQAEKFGAEIIEEEAVSIKPKDKKFTVKTADDKEYEAKAIILATGMPLVLSGIKNEEKFTGKGVHYCVVCDGFFYKGKKLAVIGHSNFAAEEALELLTYTKNITIISNGREFDLSPEMKKEIEKNKIKLIKDQIASFEGSKAMEKLVTTEGKELKFDGVFMGIGTASAASFAKTFGIETKGNSIVIDREGKTNVPGIYAAGTCTGAVSQVSVSVGEGCTAAMSVIKQLKDKKTYIDYGEKK